MKIAIKAGIGASVLLMLAACGGGQSPDVAANASPDAAPASAHAGGHGEDHAPVGEATNVEFASEAVQDGHGMHGYTPPSLDQLGGKLELVEVTGGKLFTDKDLSGSWSLVYLGYMECLEACPIALKSMPVALKEIQAAGINAKAVFIDINAPRLDDMSGAMGHDAHAAADHSAGGHGAHGAAAMTGPEVRRKAIVEWGKQYDPSIVMLAGSRKQVNQAKKVFLTRVEQSMLPTKEVIHHLNHTTYIYVMNPEGKVAGLLYHSDSTKKIADTVRELAKPGSTSTPT